MLFPNLQKHSRVSYLYAHVSLHLPYCEYCISGAFTRPKSKLHVINIYFFHNSSFQHTVCNFHWYWQFKTRENTPKRQKVTLFTISIDNKHAKFYAKRLGPSENIVESRRGLLFLTHPVHRPLISYSAECSRCRQRVNRCLVFCEPRHIKAVVWEYFLLGSIL